MQRSVTLMALAAILLSSTGLARAQDAMPAGTSLSNIQFTMEALYMSRSAAPNMFLLHDDNLGTDVYTDGVSTPFSMAPGGRFGMGADVYGPWGVEGNAMFTGTFSRNGSYFDQSTDNLQLAYTGDVTSGYYDYDNSEDAQVLLFNEQSMLGSGEINATYDLGNFKLLFGPRSIYYQSQFSSRVADDIPSYNMTSTGNDYIDITSANLLVGGQIGLEGMYRANDIFSFGGRVTAGLYANFAKLDRNYRADDAFSSPYSGGLNPAHQTGTAIGLAESLELSPKVAVAITPTLDLTFGATAIMLNGVDEARNHWATMGVQDGNGAIASEAPAFHDGVNFGGVTFGIKGHF